MVAWGMMIPVFMRASWFKTHGYKKADRDGVDVQQNVITNYNLARSAGFSLPGVNGCNRNRNV
jgi:hypothetical protein